MSLKNGLIFSFGVHAIIISFMILNVVFFPDEALDLSTAIRVDMVALPDKISNNELPEKIQDILKDKPEPKLPEKPEPKPAEKKEAKLPEKIKPEPKKEEAIKLEKVKDKQKAAMEKLKQMSALEKIKQDVKKEAAVAAALKGRVLSAGTQITGLDKLQSNSYLSQLDAQIKAHWGLPQWLIGKPLKARILVKFDGQGQILSRKISQSSGNPTYDEYCLAAIDQAAPFPKVPEKFTEVYKIDGVVIGFPE